MFNFGTPIGTAEAKVVINTDQARQSVETMRQIARQIQQAVTDTNRSMASMGTSAAQAAQKTQQAVQRQMQQSSRPPSQPRTLPEWDQMVQGERAARQQVLKEIKITQDQIAQARANLTQQQQRYNVAAAGAPSGTDRRGVLGDLAAAKQPIVDAQAALAQLKTQIDQLSPRQQLALIPQLHQLQQEAQATSGGIDKAANSITRFSDRIIASRSGVQGYFTAVRENLERINETSLAANLQEISFRLLPIGLAAGAATARGVSVSESLEEARLSFAAFTGDEQTAVDLMKQLTEQAHRFGLPMIDVLNVMQRFAPLIREAGLSLNDTINIAARLATLNPAQGIEGALFAINEALAGQWRSLQFRFNVPTEQLRGLIDTKGFIGGMDEFLNKLGRTTEFAEAFGETTRASFTKLTDSVNNFLQSAMNPFLGAMTDAADSATEFFNRLADGSPIIADLTGGLLLFVNLITTALISVGQLALGINAIRALSFGTIAAAIASNIGIALLVALPTPIVSAFVTAGAGITAAVSAAVRIGTSAGITAAYAAVPVAGGVLVGTQIAGRTGVGGSTSPEDAMMKFVQILATGVSGFVAVIEIFGQVLINGGNIIGAAIQNIVLSLATIGPGIQQFIAGLLGNLANIVQFTINQYAPEGSALRSLLFSNGRTPADDLYDSAQNMYQDAADAMTSISNRFVDIGKLPFFPSPEQLEQIRQNAYKRIVDAVNFFTGSNIQTSAPIKGTPVLGAGGSGNAGFTGDELERVYDLLVNHMIQATRRAEDEALAAAREIEDFFTGRSRAIEDFLRQTQQAVEDFNRDRQGRIDDFNRQIAKDETQSMQERAKNLRDFEKEERRRQQDHLRDMIRAARSVDDALSGRDFLSAQKALQDMRDRQEDFDTETQRRREDYTEQQQELEDNLKEQQDTRREDFDRQLRELDDNFRRQQSRQQQEFSLRLRREDEDRALRQFREEQDRQITRAREQQDFDIQLSMLSSHNATMAFIWQYGLGILEQQTQDFWNKFAQSTPQKTGLQVIGDAIGNVYSQVVGAIQSAVTGPSATASGYNYATGIYPSGFTGTPFADGGLVTSDGLAMLHAPEIIVPMAGKQSLSSIGGDTIIVEVDARGSTMNEDKLVAQLERVIVPRLKRAIDEERRALR